MNKVKCRMSAAAFAASLVIGFIALFIPPTGIIDKSVLWFTAQLLIFTSGMLGVNLHVDGKDKVIEVKADKE